MKKIFFRKTLLFLCAFFFICAHAWGAIGGGASVEVRLAEGVDDSWGTVYVMLADQDANGNPIPAMIDRSHPWKYEQSDAVGGFRATERQPAKQYFTLYAVPAHGYKFKSWNNSISEKERGRDGIICTGYSTESTPLLVEVQYYDSKFTNWKLEVSFEEDANPYNVTFAAPVDGGEYSASIGDKSIAMGEKGELYSDEYVSVSATPKEGYFFYRYYTEDAYGNRTTLGQIAIKNQLLQVPAGAVSVGAEFTNKAYAIVAGDGVGCFGSFKDALQATRKTDGTGYYGTILLLKDAILPAGNYTLPAGVSLIIPKDAEQVGSLGKKVPRVVPEDDNKSIPVPSRAYCTLTLSPGVNMDVYGELEVGCLQAIGGAGYTGTGRPAGETYGHLVMEEGSHITLMNGSNLRAWGFVTGKGEMDARRGAVVQEQFQVMDWPGGSAGLALVLGANDAGVFPINQYYIQNVEVPVTYRPGSKLFTSFGVYAAATNASMDDIGIIGSYYSDGTKPDDAMFIMNNADDSEDTWVRKYYDVENDRQVYEINNSAKINGMVINLGVGSLDSKTFVLPITSNMTIHLLSGEMGITQDIELLPAAQIEVDKESTVTVEEGKKLYLLDLYSWADKTPVYGGYVPTLELSSIIRYKQGFASQVNYTPSHDGTPDVRIAETSDLDKVMRILQHWPGASVNVHGTLRLNGTLYTSQNDNNNGLGIGWANVYSTNEDAGTILFNTDAPTEESDLNVYNGNVETISCAPAVLRNGDGSLYDTKEQGVKAGSSICYMNNSWNSYTHDGCFEKDNYGHYYAKPGEFVEVHPEQNPDGTYSDAAGAGRLFILMEDCQWWEVENVDNLYHCIHPQNDTYYEYKDGKWQEKRFTITWNDWDGTLIETYNLPYGVTPVYRGTKPTRPANADYSYDFDVWQPTPTPVTGNATYTATYTAEQIKHNIIFRFADDINGGAEIERQLLPRDTMPLAPEVRKHEDDKDWYIYWTPTVAAVTGPATYIANWQEEAPAAFDIRFQNYDGSELTTVSVDNGGTPVYGDTPVRPATDEYTYTFIGWQPAIAIATAPATYTAQFTSSPRKYTITFQDENGDFIEKGEFAYGATPVCTNMPTKEDDAEWSYSFAWIPQIQSVDGDQTYKAGFTPSKNRYTVKLMSNNDDVCTLSGAGVYDYGTDVSVKAVAADGYELVKWMEDGSTDFSRTLTVTGNITLTMQVKKTEVVENNVDVTAGVTRDFASAEDVTNLVIHSNGSEAGQIIGAENITLYGEADYKLSLNAAARTWYAVAVPWSVNAETGIYDGSRHLALGTDFDLIWYDGKVRATQGPVDNCWRYVEYDNDKTMLPGRAYMIYLARPAATLTFRKAGRAALLNTTVALTANTYYTDGSDEDNKDANWNGIANPTVYKADLNVGTPYAQYFYNGAYSTGHMNNLIVGQPVFVQVPNAASVVIGGPSSAPVRRGTQTSVKSEFELTLSNGARRMDNLFVAMDEDKETDRYTIGSDLQKMGVSATAAQMWVNRYDARLCVNTMAPFNGTAEFPLSLYAPAAGDYTVAVQSAPADGAVLYLTHEGRAVWNLSEAPYTLTLNRGTDTSYGLRIVEEKPVATSIDEAQVDNGKSAASKVLIDGVIYILREGKVYSISGQVIE